MNLIKETWDNNQISNWNKKIINNQLISFYKEKLYWNQMQLETVKSYTMGVSFFFLLSTF